MRQVGRLLRQHLDRILRVDEPHQPDFLDRVEDDDLAAALHRLLQRMQETRAVGAGVLPEIEDRVAMLEVLERAGANRRSRHLLQRNRRGLVAHVGAVGQVIVAIGARQQRVEVARF